MNTNARNRPNPAIPLPAGAGAVTTEEPPFPTSNGTAGDVSLVSAGSPELQRALAEVKGQAQFLLYLADQIEESLQQLATEGDPGHATFLCKVLGMYSGQLESKHQGLGDKIAETCQEVYITVREYDMA